VRLAAHHGDSLRAENLGDAEGGVEGDVGEDIHHGHQDAGDGDGAGQVPHRVLRRKKRVTSFPSPAGMSLTKLPLGRNNQL
jgi:hypothetical protein